MAMYTRSLKPPTKNFFLFGPRGTGKSTWVKQNFPGAAYFDLLKMSTYLKLQQDPTLFSKEVGACSQGSWIIVDEIQKLPFLLDEIHSLIENSDFKFVLSGSSARKLKRQEANLLAGRAITKHFFPLTFEELREDFQLIDALKFGTLPSLFKQETGEEKIEFLMAYATNYLKEEIQQEAAVKNLSSFSRFLSVAALMNGQKVNLSNLARDSGVARPTVQGYFQILVETLIGSILPAWPIKIRVKEVDHPKFYFFDPGIVRALLNHLYDPLDSIEKGILLETYMLHELKAHLSSRILGGEFYYWGTHSGIEVDFVWVRGKRAIGFEIKSSNQWKSNFSDGLKILLERGKIEKAFGIYLGTEALVDHEIRIFPVLDFLQKLSKNQIF